MRPSPMPFRASIAAIFVILCLCPVGAQMVNTEFQISKIETSMIASPDINAGEFTKKGASRPAKWLVVDVAFTRAAVPKAPLFLEEVTVNYYVLLDNKAYSPDKKPTLLNGAVTHVSIPVGKDLHSCIFLSPRTLARFFDGKVPTNPVTDVGVAISGPQGLLASSSWKGTVARDGTGWWADTAKFSPTAGFLLNKNETPFAHLSWDYYEPIKSAK